MSKNLSFTTLAAHAYHNGKVTCTVLLEESSPGLWALRLEGSDDILLKKASLYEIQTCADMYLAGFIAGYDEGAEHANEEHTGHDRQSELERAGYRDLRSNS